MLEVFCLPHVLFENNQKVCSVSILDVFNSVFQQDFNTVLKGGASEPLYVPACNDEPAKVLFRDDYVSSALHEVSHWVIAGHKRRQLEDYGYWYETDGRDACQQKAFEQVEVKPQAVELLLHYAAGLNFCVSVDNLALPEYDAAPFKVAVFNQVARFIDPDSGDVIPARAVVFIKALLGFRGIVFVSNKEFNQWLMLSIKA